MRKTCCLIAFCLAGLEAQTYTVQLPDSIAAANTPVTWVKKISGYCEGPAWEAATGAVYFTEQIGTNWPIWKIKPGTTDTGSVFVNARENNGMEFDPQGRLVSCQDGRVVRFTSSGAVDSVLAQSGQNGVTFGQANDLSIGSNGSFYFTDHANQVFFVNASGQLSVAGAGFTQANGLEWIEEEGALFVNETSVNRIRRFTVSSNGALINPTLFASPPGPDGGAVDAHENRYVASYTQGEVRVFNNQGDSLGRIVLSFVTGTKYDVTAGVQGNVTNCAFGGPDNKTLYISGDGGLYSVPLLIPGRSRPSTAIHPLTLSPLRKNSTIHVVDPLGRKPDLLRQSQGAFVPSLIRIP